MGEFLWGGEDNIYWDIIVAEELLDDNSWKIGKSYGEHC